MAEPSPLVVEREEIDDGLTLVRQAPPSGSPSVQFTYIGPGGTAYDPGDLAGLALLDAELAVLAAGPWDRRALARRLDSLGATLNSQPSPECAELSVWGPRDRWRELLEVLAEAVLRPRFDAKDLEIAKRQLVERQLREATQPDSRADTEFLEALFPSSHPYHRSGIGTRASVGRIRQADLRRFHGTHYVPGGAALVATSGAPAAALRDEVRRRFRGEWAHWQPVSRPDGSASPRRTVSDRRLAMPDRTQVEIRLGCSAPARSAPGYPALFLGDEVLGGRPLLGRLFQHVRERSGLAYHSSSELESMAWGGFWVARAGTGPERAAQVERLLREELAAIRERPVPTAELDRIRESSIGSIQLGLETTSRVHDVAVEVAYYGLPEDYYREWPARLRAVRPSEIQEAAASAIDPEATVLVTTGT